MNENEMIPNIPEHLWSAMADVLRGSLWNIEAAPLQQPHTRVDALISYCNWYYDRYGTPADLTDECPA